MLARTARGESGSAQPSASATCAGPKPWALRSSVPRLPGSATPCSCSPTCASGESARERREVVGAEHADGAARVRERRERLHDLARAALHLRCPAAMSSSAMRSLPRSSSTKASTGAMPAASAARSASSPSSTKSPVRLRSLASPSARAALTRPLARLVIMPAPRSRQRPVPTRDARRPSRPRSAQARVRGERTRVSRRQSDGIAAQSAMREAPVAGVARRRRAGARSAVEPRGRSPRSPRPRRRDRGASAPMPRCGRKP